MGSGQYVAVVALSERGFSILEMTAAIGALALLVVVSLVVVGSRTPYGVSSAETALAGAIDETRSLASTSGDGATLAIAATANGATGAIYAGRPDGTTTLTTPVRTVAFAVPVHAPGIDPDHFALFVASGGTVSAAAWAAGQGAIATEPSCSAPIAIVVGTTADNRSHQVGCDEARLR